jgi:hypothetical protein
MQRGPYRVLTMGLHGSASTWVFNIARELLGASFGDDAVHPCHATKAQDVPAGPDHGERHVVAKTHGWPTLAAFARDTEAHLIVSVRDPRDAVVSYMQRFGEPFDRSLRGIGQDCNAALACARAGFPVLRYEDRFFDKPATVGGIARYLGVAVTEATAARLFAAYSTDAVRKLSAGIATLPPERLLGSHGLRYDRVSQITHAHIGDGRAGKWREVLDPGQQAIASLLFRPFLATFRYGGAAG